MNTDYTTMPPVAPELATSINKVRVYLGALEARDIDVAQGCLAKTVAVTGPGGRPAGSVQDIIANSSLRYRRIGKHITRFDAMPTVDGGVIVYCIGTLHGEWLDGRAFSGIRFIDRFELWEGLITVQEVWNDAAEHRLREVAIPND
jgi:hypothetical protein